MIAIISWGCAVAVAPGTGPVSEFCVALDQLRIASGMEVPLLAKQLSLSRAQLYAILAGRVKRPPDWDRVVRPFVDACAPGQPEMLAAWRRRHAILTEVWEQLRRRDQPQVAGTAPGQPGKEPPQLPRQLPAAVSCFTGRAAELAVLTGLLQTQPGEQAPALVISAIGGTAGAGKTALAIEWAHRVAGRFPDGQLYVNLRGYDPDQPVAAGDALAGFLRALGVPGHDIPDPVEDRAGLYRSKLAGRRVLVLLDNARDGDQVRPLLPGDPSCAAVVTSRDTLAGLVAVEGARRLDLDVLPSADAIALLRSLIGPRIEDDPQSAAALAGLCARLPLALRIAAELAAARPSAPLADLVTELQANRLDTLNAGEDRADVRAVISWSVRELPEGVAEAFVQLSLHPGLDLDVHATSALTGAPTVQARRVLGQLHRASLLQSTGPGRYGMHDLLRAYAREQAAARDTDRWCHRALTSLFDYYLAAAGAATDILFPAETHRRPRFPPAITVVPELPGEAEARAWLDRERANLVAVVVHSAEHSWPGHASRLAGVLYRYLLHGSHLPEAKTIYGRALQAARRSSDLTAEASALNALGSIAMMKGRFPDAAGHYEAALERYRQSGDRSGQARALYNLGQTEYQLHDLRSAASHFHQAIAAYQDVEDSLGTARALTYLAGAESELGWHDQASEHLELAQPVFRNANDPTGEADVLQRMARLECCRGQLTAAVALYDQALAIFRRIEFPTGVAAGLCNLGEVSVRQGKHRQAISYLRQALAVCRQVGYQHGEIVALRTLAQAFHGAARPAAARIALAKGLQLAAETGNTYEQANAHYDLAESHQLAGQHQQAHYHWRQALALFTHLGAAEADQVQSRLSAQNAKAPE
jgi:tetratricopeptide (TPR) repeat protein